MKKRVISVLLCTAMAATMLAGCGSASADTATTDTAATTESAVATTETASDDAAATDEGKVLNIRCWNDEFRRRMVDHYPGYEKIDDTTGKIGDVTVMWSQVPSDDNAYQNALDEALLAQDSAKADDKIDMFLIEADYALKYVDTDYTLDVVNDIGVSEDDLKNQYKYTQDIVTDSNGKMKGISWQGCPAGMIYRRDVAKEVFGTDDPAEIQDMFSDWDKFEEAAKKLADAGYDITSSANDTYRVFSNNVTSKWVEDGKINIDPNIQKWVEMSKAMVDAGQTGTYDLWADDWSKGFTTEGNVFCYFGPAWFIDFTLGGHDLDGSWALTVGPQSFYWGGTWITACEGTDNPTLVKDIMEKMCCTTDIMTDIVKADNDFVNDKPAMDAMAADESFGDDILGGQNPLPIFCEGVENISLDNLTGYDQGCNEEFQNAMKNYFLGNATYDEALEIFYKNVETKYPELTH